MASNDARLIGGGDPHLQMFVADHARVLDREHCHRSTVPETPDPRGRRRAAPARSRARSRRSRARRRSRTRFEGNRRIAPARDFLVERARERIEMPLLDRQPRRHRMTAEAADELGMSRGDAVEHVADVDAGHRARRASQTTVGIAREGDDGPPHAILDAARDQSDDALVPVRRRTGTRRGAWAPSPRVRAGR